MYTQEFVDSHSSSEALAEVSNENPLLDYFKLTNSVMKFTAVREQRSLYSGWPDRPKAEALN